MAVNKKQKQRSNILRVLLVIFLILFLLRFDVVAEVVAGALGTDKETVQGWASPLMSITAGAILIFGATLVAAPVLVTTLVVIGAVFIIIGGYQLYNNQVRKGKITGTGPISGLDA